MGEFRYVLKIIMFWSEIGYCYCSTFIEHVGQLTILGILLKAYCSIFLRIMFLEHVGHLHVYGFIREYSTFLAPIFGGQLGYHHRCAWRCNFDS